MRFNMNVIIGFHLSLILLVLILIFGFIYIESIDYQKHFETTLDNKRSLQAVDFTTNTTTMLPFHINDKDVICFEVEKWGDQSFVIIKYNHINMEYYISNSCSWNEDKLYKHQMVFNPMNAAIHINGWEWNVLNAKRIIDTPEKKIPIKVALQRLSVFRHYQYNPKNNKDIINLSTPILEDAMTLATISMISYSNKIMGIQITEYENETVYTHTDVNVPFYGGTILKVHGINPVSISTELPPPNNKTISVGPLLVYAWKYKDVFVVSFRGTHFKPNWSINLKCKAKEINFNGTNGHILSGMYDAVHNYFNDFMKIFDVYNNEKRIIFTGHSLGSGLAQIMLLHLLDINNKKMLTHKVYDIMYGYHASIEYVTFGGPAIMDKNLGDSLKKALNIFNHRNNKMMYQPHPDYSALMYTKINDPVSYSGEDAVQFLKKVLFKGIPTLSHLAVIHEIRGAPMVNELAENGLEDVTKYHHFGKKITVDSSWTNQYKEIVDLLSHAEYFDIDWLKMKFFVDSTNGWV